MISRFAILKETRQLLSDESRWTQEAYARDKNDKPVDPDHPDAKCFCVMGALMKVCGRDTKASQSAYFTAARLISRHLPKGSVLVHVNDTHGHKAILSFIDSAIRAAEQVAA